MPLKVVDRWRLGLALCPNNIRQEVKSNWGESAKEVIEPCELCLFMEHELFHLEHARHFEDCDQLWCVLWVEGLATFAASTMTPGATDHQLLLDLPTPIRPATEAHWGEALCWIATRFEVTDDSDLSTAFLGNEQASGFPSRFGYYVGLRVAAEAAGAKGGLAAVSRLNDEQARPVVARALGVLMKGAHAPCEAPKAIGPITHAAPRPA